MPRSFDSSSNASTHQLDRRHTMQWTTPSYTDLRFGFEITMYIANR
ncbi:Coenzyme PQQ synthesis protein A [Burkholderia cenocepacia KC-01]|nr:Coenzyme PQQ synthesis protein A [Burkholderia cenocepacia KC-01]